MPLTDVPNPVLTVIADYVAYPPELSYPNAALTQEPAVVLREISRNRIAHFPGDIERSLYLSGNTDLSRLLENAISSWFAILILPMCPSLCLRAVTPPAQAKLIIGYIFPKDRAIAPGEVATRKLTRINYAFANLQNSVIVEGFGHDAENFARTYHDS
jgi:hypothetical protein